MAEFVRALFNPDVPFLSFAVLAGIAASPAFGLIGTFVTVNRISYVAGAIAHSTLAGIGAAIYVQAQVDGHWFSPMLGAICAALLGAVIIGLVSIYAKEREDTVIGAVWAVGMAVGILFIASAPGYVDPMSYLFGNILLLSADNLVTIIALDLAVLLIAVLLFNQFQAISFDSEFARVRGLNAGLYYLLLVVLTAVSIVILTTIVGLILVIALLTIPAAIAGMWARRLWVIATVASLLTALFTTSGIAVSYVADLPSGATIIVVAGAFYLLVAAFRAYRRRRIA
jgi:zinc transport system permease protein